MAYDEELAIFGDIGDDWGRGLPLLGLGRIALRQGDFARAHHLLEDARTAFESAGDQRLLGFVLNRLGELARIQRDFATAVTLYRENLRIWRDLAQPLGMAASLEGVAISLLAWDPAERAARLFGAAEGLRVGSGSTRGWQTDDPEGRESAVADARDRLGHAAYATAFAEGHRRPVEQVDAVIEGRGLLFSAPHHGRGRSAESA